jgi:hypothetical protein
VPRRISLTRAERIARSHACDHCREYSFKRLVVKPSPEVLRKEFKEIWHVERTCGVCGLEQEMGISADGEIVYAN